MRQPTLQHTVLSKPGTDFVIPPTEFDVAFTDFTEDPSENGTVWLQLMQDINPQVDFLETSKWINKNTRRWKVSFVTYNADFDILTISSIHFILSRSGRIWKEISFMSLYMSPYANLWGLVWEILFFGSITTIFIEELLEIIRGLCARGTDGKCRCRLGYFFMDYFTVWNAVDWCSIVIAYTLLGMWIHRCILLADLQTTLSTSLDVCASTPRDRNNCDGMTEMVMAQATATGEIASSTSLVSSFYPFCILLRLFKTFSLQPRLAVVTRTLWMSFADLVHFGIIFLSVFLTYVFMAMGFFGRTVEGYADFGVAFITLFRSLMGDADFPAMEDQVGRAIAGVFHITFMLCMLLILLNMLIAIIMDVYGETKRNAQFSDPVWNDIYDFFYRWYHARKGDRVSLSKAKDLFMTHLEEKADKEDEEAERAAEAGLAASGGLKSKKSMFVELEESEDIVTVEHLMEKVGMDEHQAWDSIVESVKWFEKNAELDVPTVEVLRGVRQVQTRLGCQPVLHRSTTAALDLSGMDQADGGAAKEKGEKVETLTDPMVQVAIGPDLKTMIADSLRRLEFESGMSARSKKMVSQLLDTAQSLVEDEGIEKRL
ncbi:pkd2 [Symbiodinium pilosum]|uniref:Pkd2 protein n=1 Tax=Symbiodinium pilosum TaxID=2952 RepID=A0A812KJX5_SYMPI|nr:pkd2 [Symbiodinium pilosum]